MSVELLTTVIRRLREEIARADWEDADASAQRLQLAQAEEAHARGDVWWVWF